MGQKVNPIAFRLGIIRDWDSRWYARKATYRDWIVEDARVRRIIRQRFASDGSRRGGSLRNREAGVSRIEVERAPNMLKLTLHTAKPGIIIGRGGQGVEEIRADIERLVKRKVHINVQEVRQPELDATLVAQNVASQIERRVAFKRAVRQALQRSMRMGAKGIRVLLSGRLGGAEMSRKYGDRDGKIPLHTLRADIDYGFTEARTASGNIGVKVWLYRGEVLPQAPAPEPRPLRAAVAPEKPRKGWRRVSAVRKVQADDAEVSAAAEAAPSPEQPAPGTPQLEETSSPQPSPLEPASTEQPQEQNPDVDAVEDKTPEAAEGPQTG
jgi:small subunit ribosomal protein S3